MPSVCLHLHMHQPLRLRRYSVFDTDAAYFDAPLNREAIDRAAAECYEPATRLLLQMVRGHGGRFRLSFSVTSTLLDQLRDRAPRVIDHLVALSETGFVEVVAEPAHHSLAFLFSRDEFRAQAEQHAAALGELFGQTPRVFQNTELIYNNDLAQCVESFGRYDAVLAGGGEPLLGDRTANRLYRPAPCERLALLVRTDALSDALSGAADDPPDARQIAAWIAAAEDAGPLCNLFVDLEALTGRNPAARDRLPVLRELPEAVAAYPENRFRTLSEAIAEHRPDDAIHAPEASSWARPDHDLADWLGNAMQINAMQELYKLETPIRRHADGSLLADWQRLTGSDQAGYMSTKRPPGLTPRGGASPYESPYDAYISFMNVLDNLRTRAAV